MERRSGKDRREYTDPRYESADFPEFVDRRKGERRQLDYENLPGHPSRKWIILIGAVVIALLFYLFFLSTVNLTKNCQHKAVRKSCLTVYHDHQDGGENRGRAFNVR
jgi:hypothetical protein